MKSVFLANKPKPRYNVTWDVSVVLKYLETLYPHSAITLRSLTLKLVMIVLLTSGQRGQTVHLMSLDGMHMTNDVCVFHMVDHLKTSKPGVLTPTLVIKRYAVNEKICPLTTLQDYLARMSSFRRGEKKLFISFQKPYKPVTRRTILQWVRTVMSEAGVDTAQFHPHSTRAASTSKAVARAVPIDIITSTAGWQSAVTFQKYYHKPIVDSDGASDMATALLSSL
jgi:integrase